MGTLIALILFGALPSSRPAAPRHLVVLIADRNKESEYSQAFSAIKAQLSDLPVRLKVIWRGLAGEGRVPAAPHPPEVLGERLLIARRVARDTGAQVIVFCEFERQDVLWLYIAPWADRQGTLKEERVITRGIQKSEAEGRYEALALILRFSIRALMFRIPPQKKRKNAVPDLRDPPLSFSKPSQSLLGLSARMGGLAFAYSAKALLNPGVTVELSFLIFRAFAITAGYSYFPPVEVSGNRADVSLSRHPGHVGVAWSHLLGGFTLSASLYAILDFVSVKTKVNSIFISAIPPKAHQTVSVLPMLELRYALGSRIGLYAALGAEFFFNNRYYIVEGHDSTGVYGTETITDPWMIQPRVQIGLEVRFF